MLVFSSLAVSQTKIDINNQTLGTLVPSRVGTTAHSITSNITCSDVSGSSSAQSCSTTPTFVPAAKDTILYSTTTGNAGDLTIAVNGSSAAHVRKWLGSTVLASGDLPANVPVMLTFDGTFWEQYVIGNAPPTGSSMVYPGAGIPVSNGTAWLSSITAPTGSLVGTGQANTYSTGLQSFAAATMTLPSSAAYAPTTSGTFGYDSTNKRVVLGNGVNTSFLTWITTAPASSLNIPEFNGTLGGLSDSGIAATNVVTLNGIQTLTNKSIATTQLTGTLGCSQVPTFSGDTVTAGGTCTTVTSSINGVLLSGLATGLLKITTGTGVPSVLTIASPLSIVGTALSSSIAFTSKTGNYTLADGDRGGVLLSADGSNDTYTLPNPSGANFANGWYVYIKNGSTANTIALTPGSPALIDGLASLSIQPHTAMLIEGDGTNYHSVVISPNGNNAANLVFASPNGSSGAPLMRALVAADINGGSGATSSTFLCGNFTWCNTIPVMNVTTQYNVNNSQIACTNLADCGTLVTLAGANVMSGANSLNSAGSFDGSATLVLNGTKLQALAGAVPTLDGAAANNITNHTFVFGSNGSTLVAAVAATGTGTATSCTNQFVSAISGLVAPTCSTVALSQVGALAASTTLVNGNNPLTLNFAQTTNSQSSVTIGETTAATGTSDNVLTLSALANSTATVLNITQGSNTGTTNAPALNLSATYNNASLTGKLISASVTNTTSSVTSSFLEFDGGTGGATAEVIIDLIGDIKIAGNYESTGASAASSFLGGVGTGNVAGTSGAAIFRASDNTNTGASAQAGLAILRSGYLTTATPNAAAVEGLLQLSAGAIKGTTITAVGDVLCASTTAYNLTDCPHLGPYNVVGVASSITNPIGYIHNGQAIVKLDGAIAALGDIICVSATVDGQAHDNGTTVCPTPGTLIGIAIADAGTVATTAGSSTSTIAMSTTLVEVQLMLGGGGSSPSAVSLNQVTALAAPSSLTNGNNTWTLNFAQTTNSQSAVTIGETSAATGTTSNQLTISTQSNSTATLLNLSQGSNTGTTNTPAFNATTTYNNSSLIGKLFTAAVTNTSSSVNSEFIELNGGSGGATLEFAVDLVGDVKIAGNYEGTGTSAVSTFLGGLGTGNVAGTAGPIIARASDNSNTSASAQAGLALVRSGMLTTATPNAAALEGMLQLGAGALKGTAIVAVGDILCGSTTAYTLTDCPHGGPFNIVGVATSITNPVGYIHNGQALVKLDGAIAALGDIICMGTTTDGQAHDNGTTMCSTAGALIGIAIADSGTISTSSGATTATTAMSTTLVAVQLMLGGGGSTAAGVATLSGTNAFSGANSLTSAGSFDASASTVGGTAATGFKIPVGAGNIPTVDGLLAVNSTNHTHVWGSNGNTIIGAAAATGTNTSTTCTNQVFTVISGIAAPTCTSLTSGFLPAITLDKSASGLANPTADGTFTYLNTSTTGLTIAGAAPASGAGNGTAASSLFNISAVIGGATSSTGANTGGTGSTPTFVAGAGGAATGIGITTTVGGLGGGFSFTTGAGGAGTAGNDSGGAGGSFSVTLGAGGAATGTGTVGAPGTFAIVGGTVTGALTTPSLTLSTTLNTTGIANIFTITAINTASSATSCFINFMGGAAGSTQDACIDVNGNFHSGTGAFESTVGGGNTTFLGGQGTNSVAGAVGGTQLRGSDNSNAGAAAVAGYTLLRGGFLTAATPNAAALPGVIQVSSGYLKGSAVANVGDLVCGTTTAFTVTDCPITPGTNVVGVATSTTNPIGVVGYGLALVHLDGTVTAIGDNVCLSTTTAGSGHDNGSATTACAVGTSVGVIVADSGTITTGSGSTTAATAMSTTLPLVQLHIGQ